MENMQAIIFRLWNIEIGKLSDADFLSFCVSASSFFVAVVVLGYAIAQHYSKKGNKFYGLFAVTIGYSSRQSYVSSVIIENKKDKICAISKVYLRIESNIYLELVDYADSPRIISPFETIKIELNEGVSGYIWSLNKVNISDILFDWKIPKSLVVETPQGLCKVKKYKKVWNVHAEVLRNSCITPIFPVRKFYKGKSYSDSLQFVVSHKVAGSEAENYFLHKGGSYVIGGISIRTDDFQDAVSLGEFLKCSMGPRVIDLTVERVEYTHKNYDKFVEVKVAVFGFFKTYLIGMLTKMARLRFRIRRTRFFRRNK